MREREKIRYTNDGEKRVTFFFFCGNLGLLLEDYFVAGLKYDVKSILVAAEMKNRFVSFHQTQLNIFTANRK